MPADPSSLRTSRFVPALLATLALAVAAPALAQQGGGGGGGGGGGFGGGGLGGGGNGDGAGLPEPGAYASPSAIPGMGDLGVPLQKPLQRLEPIPLPDIAPASIAPPAISLPALPGYAPDRSATANPLTRMRRLHLDARLTKGGERVPTGLVWRLFTPVPGPDGKLPLFAVKKGGSADFDLPTGTYLLHVGFGRAGVTRRIDFTGVNAREEILLEAGGLRMNARSGGGAPIPKDKLRFDVYAAEAHDRDETLVASDVAAGANLPLNAGTYRIVSHYGDENAEVRGEVKVEAGKITDVTLQHSAAELTMKLVREKGGEAIADTAWEVLDDSGRTVRESVGAFPSMVLAAGDYLVVAKNRDRTYQRDFTVEPGQNADVELLTSDVAPPGSAEGSGD